MCQASSLRPAAAPRRRGPGRPSLSRCRTVRPWIRAGASDCSRIIHPMITVRRLPSLLVPTWPKFSARVLSRLHYRHCHDGTTSAVTVVPRVVRGTSHCPAGGSAAAGVTLFQVPGSPAAARPGLRRPRPPSLRPGPPGQEPFTVK